MENILPLSRACAKIIEIVIQSGMLDGPIVCLKPKIDRQSRREKGKYDLHTKLKGVNLYIRNFDDDMTEKKLKQLFSDFGVIIYSKVMLDSQGLSRGYGFVGFVTPEDATKAMNAMNGKIVGQKLLHISIVRHKKERNTNLQVLSEQCYGGTMFTQLASEVSGGLCKIDQVDLQLVSRYQNIQETEVGEAIDYFEFNDLECGGAVEIHHPSCFHDSRGTVYG